jgi:hypothetical protein
MELGFSNETKDVETPPEPIKAVGTKGKANKSLSEKTPDELAKWINS